MKLERGDDAWKPVGRQRTVSLALQAYAFLTTSAARGEVRDLEQHTKAKRSRPKA